MHPTRKKICVSNISATLQNPVSRRHLNQGSCAVIAIADRKGTFQLNMPEAVHGKTLCMFALLIEKNILIHTQSYSLTHIELLHVFVIPYGELCLHTALRTAKMTCLSINIFFQKGSL